MSCASFHFPFVDVCYEEHRGWTHIGAVPNGPYSRAERPSVTGRLALSRSGARTQARSMLSDATQLFLGLAVLIALSVTLGVLSARLFMSASRGSDAG